MYALNGDSVLLSLPSRLRILEQKTLFAHANSKVPSNTATCGSGLREISIAVDALGIKYINAQVSKVFSSTIAVDI